MILHILSQMPFLIQLPLINIDASDFPLDSMHVWHHWQLFIIVYDKYIHSA